MQCLSDPVAKAAQTRELLAAMNTVAIDPAEQFDTPDTLPGRLDPPRLVSPKDVPTRSPFTLEGRAALLHAMTHIEVNAINLVFDAAWRFPDMPPTSYPDWLQVASEEALHFTLLRGHLQSIGFDYSGDFDAHDGLWVMAQRTARDVLARMTLVPRTLEATPPSQAKFAKAGDARAVDVLGIILRDEVHIRAGRTSTTRWSEPFGLGHRASDQAACSTRWNPNSLGGR